MSDQTIKTYDIDRYGHRFRIAVDDKLMDSHYEKGELCEYHMLDWMVAQMPRGGVWVDAGANVGNHALVFSLLADKVVAFEPMPQNFALLEKNLAVQETIELRPSNVVALRLGVGDAPGWVSAARGGTGQNCQWILAGEGSGRLQVVRIDDIVPRTEDVRVIKLDVEGMEEKAIEGAIKTINRCRPELFIEIWEEDALERIKVGLAQLGYKLIERWNVAPTYHFSASGRYPITYTKPPK
jgi:FkbM family methyltransferase